MKFGVILFAPVLALLVSGCGNLQALKVAEVPTPLKSAPIALSAQRAPARVSPGAIEIPNRSVFLKQTAGGSLAAGLLLGPIGGLANAANIERLSKELAENSKGSTILQLDAIEEAAAAWGEQSLQKDAKSLQLRPYLVLYPDDRRKSVTIIGGVFVTSTHVIAGDKVWNADYHYVLPSEFGLEVLERPMDSGQVALFKEELREGFRQIRAEMVRDLSAAQPSRRVALIWAEPLRVSLMGFAGFASGDVETEPSGRLVIRTNMENWGGSVGAASRDTPHQVWIFSKASQYRFDAEPQERRTK
ncbi:MAG: hypothetical protein EOO30_07025 [Comamonadaceae bacterium]|nr:MAG: hypothetical protein EOO30_07025 [Comamonadaceae bacterium]